MPITPTHPAHTGRPLPLKVRQRIHLQSQQAVAMASGCEAIAQRAVDDGDTSYELMQQIALLAAMTAEHVRQLSAQCAELSSPAAND